MTEIKNRISIPYHPYKFKEGGHAVEKSDNTGQKRRYLCGIISGTQIDGTEEKITAKCIKSLQDQANSGEILLYDDRHAVYSFVDDIGILAKHEIQPTGDWYGEFRLYDAQDNQGAATLEKVDKLWKQVNGLPPYKMKKQKGFSIEGFIPEGGILYMSGEGKRIIDDITLQGVIVTPNPAYTSSVATAVTKALGETPARTRENISNSFLSVIADNETQNQYYRKRYIYQDALEQVIEDIMTHTGIQDKAGELERIFDEYQESMINLIISSQPVFSKTGTNSKPEDIRYLYNQPSEKVEVLKSLLSTTEELITKIQGEL